MSDVTQALRSAGVPQGALRVLWLEQSHFVFVTAGGVRVHVDPFLSRDVKPENFIHPQPLIAPGEAPADLVLLTHDHRDHTDPYTLAPMAEANPSCLFYGPAEAVDRCRSAGIEESRLLAVAAGDRFTVKGVEVAVVYAENTSDADATTHLGFVLAVDGVVVYNVGDTRKSLEQYAHRLASVVKLNPQVMIVPINDGYNNPGPEGARSLVEMVEPSLVIPCHFGCFTHNTVDPRLFLDALPEEYRRRVRVLGRGASIEVTAAG